MIDFPWRFLLRSPKGNRKSPDAHYATMSMNEIAEVPVADLLKPGGVAWVWMTWPLLPQQMDVARHAWGLTYKTGGDWAKRTVNGKLRVGPGHIFRTVCEPFAIFVRGDKATGPRGRSVRNLIETVEAESIDGLAREHSRKPEEAYQMMRKLMPRPLVLADIFGRSEAHRANDGWITWGNEARKFNGGNKR